MKKSKRVLGLRAQDVRGQGKEEESATGRRRTEVSVCEAKDQLSALLQRAETGEEILITSEGEPKAMLVLHRPVAGGKRRRLPAAFRAGMALTPDSTSQIREMRDSGY